MAGNLNVTWIHGARNCAVATDPPIQVHQYEPNTFILRQSKCSDPGTPEELGPSFEAPFMYLLIGKDRALLLDTGASRSPDVFPLAVTVRRLLVEHASAGVGQPLPLLIVHTHSHEDHFAGDDQFRNDPNTTIIPLGVPGVKAFFGLSQWPDGAATIDLGERTIDVLPGPGHEPSHIFLYDRASEILLTGDTLYPGLLVVNDWHAYARSVARLRVFAQSHPVSFVLGAHVEMRNLPGRWFGLGTLFQPGEHPLQLELRHLVELDGAVKAMGAQPRTDRRDEFIIYPAGNPLPPPDN
jgi:glyoxylase-like metal-dependent hydrolase (beta-lactamase superfamily II)